MIRRLAAAVLAGGVLAGAALAASAAPPAPPTAPVPGEPQKKLTPLDQAWARGIVIGPGDLGDGWKSSRAGTTGGDLRCAGFAPDESDLVESGAVDGLAFSRGTDGAFVSSSSSVFRTLREAEAAWKRSVRPGVLRCLSALLGQLSSKGVSLKITSRSRLPFPQLSPRTSAYRVTAELSKPKVTLPVALDAVLLGGGRAEAAVFMMGVAKPLTPAFEHGLARVVARRLRAS